MKETDYKTLIRFFTTMLCAATASVVIVASPAQAGYVVTLTQVGPNVVASGSGAIDLSGLALAVVADEAPGVVPNYGIISTGTTALVDLYTTTGYETGPLYFGTGMSGSEDTTLASSGSGDMVGFSVRTALGQFPSGVSVPYGYMTDNPLSDSATYDNSTFSSLGVVPGTYEWTWGTATDQNFTLQIGPAAVPEPATWALLLAGLMAIFGLKLSRSKQA